MKSTSVPTPVHFLALAGAAAILLSPRFAHAQYSLIHRYSFNGNANDSVGTANGTVIGGVSFNTDPGIALFPGGNTVTNPAYISLPVSSVNTLQNATIEIFTSAFSPDVDSPPNYEALFSAATNEPNTANYQILSPNRGNGGMGTGARINSGTEQVITSTTDPLPQGYGDHVIDLVFSGFNGIGSTGTETIYLDGKVYTDNSTGNPVTAATKYSYAYVNSGTNGIQTVGIGGGSPFTADPTFDGNMDEFRIFNGALTLAQIVADNQNGPDSYGMLPEPGSLCLLTAALPVGLFLRHRTRRAKRASIAHTVALTQ